MMLIVLSLVHIDASVYRSVRQATPDECSYPTTNFCDFVVCANGQCVENKTSSQCFQCQCDAGFTGQLCETTLVTPTGCDPACENGGQCQQTSANTHACVCLPEYTGSQCQTSIIATHPCTTMPGTVCQNGGTCTMNGAGYLCSCAIGWSGSNCETQNTVTTCTPNPCGAHGTCFQAVLPTGPIIHCNCEAQWTGKFCDTNVAGTANCAADFCQSGGLCLMNGNTPYCVCPSTHTGPRCETLVSPLTTVTMTTPVITTFTQTSSTMTPSTITPMPGSCSLSPCLNGGSCYTTGNTFICLCRPDWSGLTCNVPTSVTTPAPSTLPSANACLSSPCNNGGTCYRHGNSFVCVCTTFYAGTTCDMAKTATPPSVTTPSSAIKCINQPCQNGATCYDTASSYFCYCGMNSNFSGKDCETPKVQSPLDCPLNCGSGQCMTTGHQKYACMCNGMLKPTSCSNP